MLYRSALMFMFFSVATPALAAEEILHRFTKGKASLIVTFASAETIVVMVPKELSPDTPLAKPTTLYTPPDPKFLSQVLGTLKETGWQEAEFFGAATCAWRIQGSLIKEECSASSLGQLGCGIQVVRFTDVAHIRFLADKGTLTLLADAEKVGARRCRLEGKKSVPN